MKTKGKVLRKNTPMKSFTKDKIFFENWKNGRDNKIIKQKNDQA